MSSFKEAVLILIFPGLFVVGFVMQALLETSGQWQSFSTYSITVFTFCNFSISFVVYTQITSPSTTFLLRFKKSVLAFFFNPPAFSITSMTLAFSFTS